MKAMMVMWMVVLCSSYSVAEIYFKDTEAKTEIQTYSRQHVKSQPVITYNVYDNQVYYAYVSDEQASIFNTDSPIKNIVVGAAELLNISPEAISGQRFFTIRAAGEVNEFIETTLQVITEDYTTILQVILTPYKRQQNKVINLQDGARHQMVYSQKRFLEQEQVFQTKLNERDQLMSELLYNESISFPINQVIDIKESKLDLKNVTIINQTYMFNIEFRGQDPVELEKDDIFVYLTPYQYIVLSEQKGHRKLYYPEDIVLYQNSRGLQCATLIFSVDEELRSQFYAQLYLSQSIIFDTKINLELLASHDDDVFDIRIR